jgi:dolichol-phosphate mannosyltransferase
LHFNRHSLEGGGMTRREASMNSGLDAIVVLPTFNESQNVRSIIERLLQLPGVGVIVVDDGSPDGTGDIADQLAHATPGRVEVIHRPGPRGLGRSYVDGLRRALTFDAPAIIQMDADWSHDPEYVPSLLEALETHDLVIGSRYVQGVSVVNWPLRRILLSAFANRYIRGITGLRARDCTSGYRCWRRTALARLPLHALQSEGYAFLVELLFQAHANGCHIGEVPIIFVERRAGASKISGPVLFESLATPWRLLVQRTARRAGAILYRADDAPRGRVTTGHCQPPRVSS